uniref:ARM repeat superfamily protein n=1 Tax=Ascaris lumbricoides TaxID=6252 RepID=A0A0M3IRY7_ASCLU
MAQMAGCSSQKCDIASRLVLNLSYGGLDARSLAMQLPLICEDIVRNTAIHCVDLLFKRNDGVDMAWIGPLLQSKKRVAVYIIDT